MNDVDITPRGYKVYTVDGLISALRKYDGDMRVFIEESEGGIGDLFVLKEIIKVALQGNDETIARPYGEHCLADEVWDENKGKRKVVEGVLIY